MAKPNHGTSVSGAAEAARNARTDDGPQGIGPVVSEAARNKGPDFADGVITVINADGDTDTFTTFADALIFAEDGAVLQVGQGTYEEAFELNESVTIVGENGAIVDGSGIAPTAGTQSTIELFEGFSGGSISGLTVVAIEGGNAVLSIFGEAVDDITLEGNTFDAGQNTAGSLVYFNPEATNVDIIDNVFEGALLAASPFLGIEADNVLVKHNHFGDHPDTYPEVEIFEGANGTTEDVVLVGNTGLAPGDVFIV